MSTVIKYLEKRRDELLRGVDRNKEELETLNRDVACTNLAIQKSWDQVDEINFAIEKFKEIADIIKEGENV